MRHLINALCLVLIISTTVVTADILSFPWATTFDYSECTQRGGGGGAIARFTITSSPSTPQVPTVNGIPVNYPVIKSEVA